MKTLIAYATKHGATKKCSEKLSQILDCNVDLVDLKKETNINLDEYEKVIVGSSIYIGKIRKEASNFCLDNLEKLRNKKLAFFICCMKEGKEAEEQLNSFPEKLIKNSVVTATFGGEYNFKKMNFIEKVIVKKIAGVTEDQSNISEYNITNFAREILKS